MVGPRNRSHFIVTNAPDAVAYQGHGVGRGRKPPAPNRQTHGASLKSALQLLEVQAAARRAAGAAAGQPNYSYVSGIYVEFESVPGVPLNVKALEDRRANPPIEVVAFSEDAAVVDGEPVLLQRATVFVPDGAVRKFIDKFTLYEETPPADTPPQDPDAKKIKRHHDAFDRVQSLRAATLKALWTDAAATFPSSDDAIWWEVWLRSQGGAGDAVARFRAFSDAAGIVVGERTLAFDDRSIVLAHGRPSALASSLDLLDAVAELRGASSLAVGIERLTAFEQREYVDDVLQRIERRTGPRPSVCILDTGVTREHPLLRVDLAAADLHSLKPQWGTADHDGHGTEMAGLALFGDMAGLILGTDDVDVQHGLESVKILAPPGATVTSPDLFGAATAEAVNRPEITAPNRNRVYSMAITASPAERGAPTSWSAAVDALAAGRSFDQADGSLTYLDDGAGTPRLFVVSAGNVDDPALDHVARSDLAVIEDPAQAWNALTVGAHTERSTIVGRPHAQALAAAGDLSPWSRTSVGFAKKWPIKPDVVFEGGNLFVRGGVVESEPLPELNLLTTSRDLQSKMFDLSWATSAATAQVARQAARVWAAYPTLGPESIRALIVHSARWTPQMLASAPGTRRSDVLRRVRRYGFGVPSEDRAVRSARDALTLVHEGVIHPFAKTKIKEMHVHELPWPEEALASLGAANVTLRVTLSYFIEPNPSRRGQDSRYRYPSHGLRFALKKPTESQMEFRKRINKLDLDNEEQRSDTSAGMDRWLVGQQRDLGSIHTDAWEGSAVELATCGTLAVYPVSGWWKDLPSRDRSSIGARYSLVVSIETEALPIDVDLWMAVAVKLGIAIET